MGTGPRYPGIRRVAVPSIVINADADTGVFPTDAAAIVAALGSTDTSLHTVTGDHYFQSPEAARDEVADLVVSWAGKRW